MSPDFFHAPSPHQPGVIPLVFEKVFDASIFSSAKRNSSAKLLQRSEPNDYFPQTVPQQARL
jgi:hypothetical protein